MVELRAQKKPCFYTEIILLFQNPMGDGTETKGNLHKSGGKFE